MNNFKNFLISNLVVVAFVTMITLVANLYILNSFTLNKEIYFGILLILIIGATFLYYVLTKTIFIDMQKSTSDIDFLVKQTLHELNTPIATIKTNLKMLKNKEMDEKTLSRLQRIESASDRLYELYEAMEYEIKSKIGKTSPEIFDIHEIINKSINKHKELNTTITLTNLTPNFFISCDKFGFIKTIDNLVSNAIKYNHSNGFVTIGIENKVLYIEDSGIGIETKNLFLIFEAYFQANTAHNGYGLGLAIVKKFCDENKIKISLKSDENGTIFYLDLQHISC